MTETVGRFLLFCSRLLGVALLLAVVSALVGLLGPHPNAHHIGYQPILLCLTRLEEYPPSAREIIVRSYVHYCLMSFIGIAILVNVIQKRRAS
jgi:hypothetical protein